MTVKTTKTFGCSIKWADKRESVKQVFEQWAKEPVTIEPITLNGIQNLVKNAVEQPERVFLANRIDGILITHKDIMSILRIIQANGV